MRQLWENPDNESEIGDLVVRYSLIVAMAENRVIGKDNGLPWHLPEDLKRFKRITMGKPLLMGRKTFQSLGKPLPGRPHVVVTRDPGFQYPGVIVAHSLGRGLELAAQLAKESGCEEVMIIGGAEIYRQAIGLMDRMYITMVDGNFEGDAYFPEFPPEHWRRLSCEQYPAENGNPGYCFLVFERD